MSERTAITAAARAIVALDNASFSRKGGQDQTDWDAARAHLWAILSRNGYEFSSPGSARIKQVKKPKGSRQVR